MENIKYMLIPPYYYGCINMRNKDSVILRWLIEKKNEELNILNIANEIKMDYKNVYSIVKRLEKESLVVLERFGQSNRVKLIQKVHPLIFEVEYERRKTLLKDKNLVVMLDSLKNELKTRCFVLLLFGSYAKKKQTKDSDIDIMFIVSDGKEESFEKNVDRVLSVLPLPIHALVFSEEQFNQMLYSKEPNVGKEAYKNNIILHGIETFYEMI